MKTLKNEHIWNLDFQDLTINHALSTLHGRADYFKPSQTRGNIWKIPDTDITVFVSSPLVYGNKKIDESVLISALAPVVMCRKCDDCKKTCYACNSMNQYSETCDARMIWSIMVKYDMARYFELIDLALKNTASKIVRIHESGDFISQEYVDKWVSIARAFPSVRFYTYTKVEKNLDLSALENLPNVKINYSTLPGGELNYGSMDYLDNLKEKYGEKIDICPNTLGYKVHCGKECTKCMLGKDIYICFLGHGSLFENQEKEKEKGIAI